MSLAQYLALNSRPEVAGVFDLWRGFDFEIQEQKQKRIGRTSPYPFLPFPKVFPPNPHGKKIFEAERKFFCPIPLGEYRVRDISQIYFSWCSDNKYSREYCRSFVF